MITLQHAYAGQDRDCVWIKGNLHTHTTHSDGDFSPQQIMDAYVSAGYGFLMLSDHDQITGREDLDPKGLILIPGNEITSNGAHILHVNAKSVIPPLPDRQSVFDAIEADGGFAIAAHPNWEESFAHCPQTSLETWRGYAGLEIYNGVITWLPGEPCATDRWDRLLAQGRRVWGYAHDDTHFPADVGTAWDVVQISKGGGLREIVAALRQGSFYASTGVTIQSIEVNERTIRIETENADRIDAISDYGRCELRVDSPLITYTVPENSNRRYIRFTCWGSGGRMAWTQPFFIQPGKSS